MELTIINTFRRGELIYDDNNNLIFDTTQNGYSDFRNADQSNPEQYSSDTAQKMCSIAKKIVKATIFNCLSDFLNSLQYPIRTNQQDIHVLVNLPALSLL